MQTKPWVYTVLYEVSSLFQMAPVEQQQLLPVGSQYVIGLQNPQGGAPAGAISLSTLIDYIIQRTYHDLQVLSEL